MKNFSIDISEQTQNKYKAFLTKAAAFGLEFPNDPDFVKELKYVFYCSDYVTNLCTRHPDILDELIKSEVLWNKYPKDFYDEQLRLAMNSEIKENDLGNVLHQHRSREMLRIAWRDITGHADLQETLNDLSALAEALLDHAAACIYRLHCVDFGTPVNPDGKPQPFVVIGMGKIGAEELNFSSDVDLIFAYPGNGHTINIPKSISNEEFFTLLARRFLKIFSSTTPDHLIFRVDMRLRPFGENGPLIMSFNAMEEYYQIQGREWERYALIKAKPVAGDRQAGQLLLDRLKPFIYRRYVDYGVYDALREMKRNISIEIGQKGLQNNIKLGTGGIREIEFFGQIFQLIRGGVEPILQERSILRVLRLLVDENYIPDSVSRDLADAYVFLRTVENRLQEFSDRQTHDLPENDPEKLRLAVSMGYDTWRSFWEVLSSQLQTVHYHFSELLSGEDENTSDDDLESQLEIVWKKLAEKEKRFQILSIAGFKSPGEADSLLESLRSAPGTQSMSAEGLQRLDRLMPLILKRTGASENPQFTLGRVINLITAIERRTCYISLLLENPDALTHLIKLSYSSPWIISFLSRHPLLLDELLDTRMLYTPPEKEKMKIDLERRLTRVSETDLELQIEELIIFKNVNIFHVAAADVNGAFPLMKVSDYLSDIAEVVLEKVLELSWNHLVDRHGSPIAKHENTHIEKGFAVIAYGKLGGLELGYGSDLDLVFLHTGKGEQTQGGSHPIDSYQFYARLGQRIIHTLTTHTRTGRLYDIDMRLRPSGSSGPLVSNIETFNDYQLNDAWTWEHQALVRTRPVCGDPIIIERFREIRKTTICAPRDKNTLKNEILSMRERLRNEHRKVPEPGSFHIKQDKGGIVDIEFLVQFLVLLHAHAHNELAVWSDNIRQMETLAKCRIVEENAAVFLKNAFIALRSEIHRLSLQEKPAIVSDDMFQDIRFEVRKLWDKYLADSDG